MGKSFKADVEDSLMAFYENKKRIKKQDQERRDSRLTPAEPPAKLNPVKQWRVNLEARGGRKILGKSRP